MKKAISRTRKIEQALKVGQAEKQMGLAERMHEARLKHQEAKEAGTYKPIENPRERGRQMRKLLKKEGVLK